jgi:uncharacterized protein (DUF433 family)
MNAVATSYEHVQLREDGIASIQGTTTKVIELVVERRAHGWSPEELHFQHPYLSLGQIYSALAYYVDHAQQLDSEISARLQAVDKARTQAELPIALAGLATHSH